MLLLYDIFRQFITKQQYVYRILLYCVIMYILQVIVVELLTK